MRDWGGEQSEWVSEPVNVRIRESIDRIEIEQIELRYTIELTEMGLKQQNRDWTVKIVIKQTETADRIGGQQTES